MAKTKVVVTGILGLFGSHISRFLLDKGYEVIGIDDCSGGYLDYLDPKVLYHERNLANIGANGVIEKYKPEVVIHLAAYAAECASDYIKEYNYENNVIASIKLINSCINHNVRKFIFTSSMAVMGENQVPFTEDQIPNPIDSYGIAKLTIERELAISYRKFGLQYSILRPHNIISNLYQNYSDRYRNVLAIWASSVVNGGNINVYGDGFGKRSFSDIKFMLPVVENLLTEHNGETFNIGSDQPITILAAAQKMQQFANDLGYQPKIKHLEARTEVKNAYSSHEKAIRMLGFKDETNLDQVMKDLLLWVQSQPKREVRYMDYEVTKNLYSYWQK